MTRSVTGLCVAAAFGFAVTLAAQTPSTDQYGKSSDKGHEVTVTGCLAKGGDGNYILTNARAESKPSTTTGTSGTTTTPPAASGSTSSMANTMTWRLEGGKDLDKHVGHKIEVTGKTDYTGSMGRTPGDTTASASTTTEPNPTTTAGTVGTTGSTTDPQRDRTDRDMNQPKLDVTSVKMISTSCQ